MAVRTLLKSTLKPNQYLPLCERAIGLPYEVVEYTPQQRTVSFVSSDLPNTPVELTAYLYFPYMQFALVPYWDQGNWQTLGDNHVIPNGLVVSWSTEPFAPGVKLHEVALPNVRGQMCMVIRGEQYIGALERDQVPEFFHFKTMKDAVSFFWRSNFVLENDNCFLFPNIYGHYRKDDVTMWGAATRTEVESRIKDMQPHTNMGRLLEVQPYIDHKHNPHHWKD